MKKIVMNLSLTVILCLGLVSTVACGQKMKSAETGIQATEVVTQVEVKFYNQEAIDAQIRVLDELKNQLETDVGAILAQMQTFLPENDPDYKNNTLNLPLKDGKDVEVSAFIEAEDRLFMSFAYQEKIGGVLRFLHDEVHGATLSSKALQDFIFSMVEKLALPELAKELAQIEEAQKIHISIAYHEQTLEYFQAAVIEIIEEVSTFLRGLRKA